MTHDQTAAGPLARSAQSGPRPDIAAEEHGAVAEYRSSRSERRTQATGRASRSRDFVLPMPDLGRTRGERNGEQEPASSGAQKAKNPLEERVSRKRLMGLEPTTFCMAIVWAIRINAWLCGSWLNPITADYRRFARYWSPNGPPA